MSSASLHQEATQQANSPEGMEKLIRSVLSSPRGIGKYYPVVPNGIPVRTFEEFADLLIAGCEEFMILYERRDGKMIKEDAPFDAEDPMSYILVEMLFERNSVYFYVKGKSC